ncbi:SRPBCC family protein [Pontibacter chitinilyticus]|uniref:SRPBCC family protein n=1 Tax=Pontibacter chitinilyticus TaxID=2674989 RepID=UPI00321A770B
MKLVWKIILPLPVLAATLFAASFRLPAQVHVEHRVVLAAAPEQVYPYLNNPTEWPKWSFLSKTADPTVIHLYGGPTTGVGARMQWSGDKVGDGKLQLTESISPSSVVYVQSETGLPGNILGEFRLTPVQGGTEVVWRQSAEVGTNIWDKYKGLYQQHKKQQEVEQGLTGLKTLLQNNSKRRAAK